MCKEFCLTDEEYDQIAQWANSHECCYRYGRRRSRSCCGGEISFIFTPTAIGMSVAARCICGKELKLDNNF